MATAGGLLLAAFCGCGSEPPKKKGAKKEKEAVKAEPTASSPATGPAGEAPTPYIPEKALPPLADEPLPPLDQGRVVLTLPKDWKMQSRSNQYLVLLLKSNDRQYPRIMVTAEDGPEEGFTPQNIDAQREALQADPKHSKSRQGPVRVCKMGGRPGLYYRSKAETSTGTKVDLVTFIGAVDGRRYEIQLRAIRDADDLEDDVLVAAAMADKIAYPKAAD